MKLVWVQSLLLGIVYSHPFLAGPFGLNPLWFLCCAALIEPVPLPNVSGPILTKVIEYCTHHRHDPNFHSSNDDTAADIAEWDLEFCKVDQGTLYELILV